MDGGVMISSPDNDHEGTLIPFLPDCVVQTAVGYILIVVHPYAIHLRPCTIHIPSKEDSTTREGLDPATQCHCVTHSCAITERLRRPTRGVIWNIGSVLV